jgi:sialidase-1
MHRFILLLLFVITLISCTEENTDVKVTLKDIQVPLLKGVEENPVIRMNMQPEDSTDLMVTSISVNMEGTDHLEDVKSVEIFYTGSDSVWKQNSDMAMFGEQYSPDTEIIFSGNQQLSRGYNFFWISVELSGTANLHKRVGAICTKVVFSDKSICRPVTHEPNNMQRIGVAVRQHMQDNVHTYRIPGLTTTNEGTLLAIYDVRRNSSRDLQGDIDIGVSRSTDGGNTWEPMRIGLDKGEWGGLPEKFNGISDACILADRNSGKIFLAGLWMYGVIDENGVWQEGLTEESTEWNHQWKNKGSQPGFGVKETSQFLIATSTDDGKTWSEPVNITRMCKKEEWWLFAPAPGHGITLEDGTLVFPTQGRDKNGLPFSNITYSKDGGKTWTTSNPAYSNTTENMVVQLADGRIMLNARYNPNRNNLSDNNGRVIITTADMGETWQEHLTSRSALIESTCMASLHKHVYHENGEEKSILLFSNPNTKSGRHHMTLKISFDDGESWPEEYWMLLDEGHSRGYSCITSIDEKTIGILYEGSRADMTFESIPLDEILNPNI